MRTTLRILFLLLSLAPGTFLHAQEARSFATGGCGTSLDWGPAALFWNPALLFYGANAKGVIATLGASALDTTNSGSPALDYSGTQAALSTSNPVKHSQIYRGIAAFQWQTYGVGLIHEQERDSTASLGALNFLADRSKGALTASSYDLALEEKDEKIENFCLGTARSFPLGQATAAIGSTFKVHQGTRYRRTLMTGVFPIDTPLYQRWTANSGSGYSWDFGVALKPSGAIQLGYVIENLGSGFKWKAQREDLTLDPTTGSETVSLQTSEEVDAPRPRAVRTGITLTSPSKDTVFSIDMRRFQGESHWRVGYEKLWLTKHLGIRAGTFRDEVSNRRIWAGGVGCSVLGIDLGLGVQADHFPVVQDSSLVGAAFSMAAKL